MKNSKNQLLAGLFFAFAMVLGLSAFKASEKKVNMVRYQFNNSTSTNIDQVSAWTDVTNEEPNECAPGNALPCVIEFDKDGTYPNLSSYLSSHNTAALINASPEIREKKASN